MWTHILYNIYIYHTYSELMCLVILFDVARQQVNRPQHMIKHKGCLSSRFANSWKYPHISLSMGGPFKASCGEGIASQVHGRARSFQSFKRGSNGMAGSIQSTDSARQKACSPLIQTTGTLWWIFTCGPVYTKGA